MPNTPVRAAAKGMPAINRRSLMANGAATVALATIAAPIVSQAAVPTEYAVTRVNRLARELSKEMTEWMDDLGVDGVPDLWKAHVYPSSHSQSPVFFEHVDSGPSPIARLIEAHKAAWAAFEGECDKLEKAEYGYFGKFRSSKELFVPLSLGGAQSFHYGTTHCGEEVEGVRAGIKARYASAISHNRPLEKIAPELAADAKAKLKRALKADLQRVSKVVREEEEARRAAGLTQAQEDYEAAGDAEREALLALCEYPCTTMGEARERGAYLLAIARKQDAMQPEVVEALLKSMASEAQS